MSDTARTLLARVVEAPRSDHTWDGCPVCGSTQLLALRCKVICPGCRTILQSCADL